MCTSCAAGSALLVVDKQETSVRVWYQFVQFIRSGAWNRTGAGRQQYLHANVFIRLISGNRVKTHVAGI